MKRKKREITKTKMITMKVSEQEFEHYKNLANIYKMSLSKLIRNRLNETKLTQVYQKSEHLELEKEIKRIGVNINQITKALNEKRDCKIYMPVLISIEKRLANVEFEWKNSEDEFNNQGVEAIKDKASSLNSTGWSNDKNIIDYSIPTAIIPKNNNFVKFDVEYAAGNLYTDLEAMEAFHEISSLKKVEEIIKTPERNIIYSQYLDTLRPHSDEYAGDLANASGKTNEDPNINQIIPKNNKKSS